jgi:hypothetical protein
VKKEKEDYDYQNQGCEIHFTALIASPENKIMQKLNDIETGIR